MFRTTEDLRVTYSQGQRKFLQKTLNTAIIADRYSEGGGGGQI